MGFFARRDTGLWLYGVVRFGLWLAVVTIAVFPILWEIEGSIPISSALTFINEQARFKDLLFVLVPAMALPISTITDFICASREGEVEKLSVVVALLANISVFVAGFVGFLTIKEDTILSSSQFDLYSWVLVIGLFLSGVTEVWVAVANKRHHRLHERNWNELRRVRSRVKVLENR